MNEKDITLEQLKSEKEILKNEINKLVSDFYEKFKISVNGTFSITEELIKDELGFSIISQTTIDTRITIKI